MTKGKKVNQNAGENTRTANRDNLSERRGNSVGVRAMLIMLRILGVNRTCEYVWFVALFYALFDKTARRQASYYIRHRFPNDGPLRHFYHIWALFTSQGQALVEAAAVSLGKVTIRETGRKEAEELLARPEGLIMLCSHFGQWQGMMRVINLKGRPVHVLVRPDRNVNVDKFMAVKGIEDKINVISTESGMGGLLDVYDALMKGDTVCMMGDRSRENESLAIDFLGEEAHFPVAAFMMSARTGAPVIPVFSHREKRHKQMHVSFLEAIYAPQGAGRGRERLRGSLERYVRELERMTSEHPFEYYLYENIWHKEQADGEE